MYIPKIANREDLIARRDFFKKALNAQKKQILICGGTGCVAGGSLKIYERMQELMEERGIKCTVKLDVHDHHDPDHQAP